MIRLESVENPAVRLVRALLEDKKARRAEGLFVCEGMTMLREAMSAGAHIDGVFALEGIELPCGIAAKTYEITERVLNKICDVKAPQGIVFTCRSKPQESLCGKRIIVLEELRDPGNLGTIIRTADAFSIDCVALVGDCADVTSPKVVRSTMGSIFRVPIVRIGAQELKSECEKLGIRLFGAALAEDAKSVLDTDISNGAVAIGNESRGLSDELLSLCDEKLIIPIKNAESLNASVAASVLMWEMSRK